ncbi:MAG: DUF6570 domain-containing protein, partial [bacterium]
NMTLGINELNPIVKKAFEDLTMVEEMLISPLLAIMSIFRLPGGQLVNRGFVANFSQDIQPITCSKGFGNPSGHSSSASLFAIVVFLDYFHGTPIETVKNGLPKI